LTTRTNHPDFTNNEEDYAMRPDNSTDYTARRVSRREFLGIGAAAAVPAALAGSGFGVLVPRGGYH